MKPNPIHRLPAPLEAAIQRLKLAAREAAERTIESLGLAALASTNAFHRDGLLGAQFELNRKSAVFVLKFNDAFDQRVLRELGSRSTLAPEAAADGLMLGLPPSGGLISGPAPATNWDTLSLVEDREVEAQISAERFGLEIAHACEWELRELDGYVGSLLGEAGGHGDRNPLRPDLVGHAMISGIDAVSERAEIRKVLSTELSRSLGGLLRASYAEIVADLRSAGVQPLGLSVRGRGARPADAGGAESVRRTSAFDALNRAAEQGRGQSWRSAPTSGQPGPSGNNRGGGDAIHPDDRRSLQGGLQFGSGNSGAIGGRRNDTALGQVDPALMSLIRRLAHAEPKREADGYSSLGDDGTHDAGGAHDAGGPLPNLIRAHREELRQASHGLLDHMVIDVIGFLFDQILADPKVPPQMARQIARLQLPVLRAALGDPTFFSSRRHPVRRFVNRIASLGAAFEDFDDEAAKGFLAKVRSLIGEVVDGDFDQIELYEQKLAALESYTAEVAAGDVQGHGAAAALLSEKEDQQRLRQLYALRLEGDLKHVTAPAFLREFIAQVWGQVLMRAAEKFGADGDVAQRLRNAGRELYLSVQPKATPGHRKTFWAELPKLMQELTEGMNLIGWPEAQRRAFFGQLMPAHAEALKSPAGRTLDINLMARQVEGALQRPLPSRADLKAATMALPVLTDEIIAPQFSADEARSVGLMQESAVDWGATVPLPDDAFSEAAAKPSAGAAVDAETAAAAHAEAKRAALLPLAPGLPQPSATEAAEPTEGHDLAGAIQIGFAYQMHLDGQWRKVRLSHVSAARSFFIFTHGSRHKQTVSLTQRMLVRLCETGRLKAYEAAYLIERATERARHQLAAVGSAA